MLFRSTLLNLHQRFPEKVSKKILKQIIEGCTAMFDSQVMHRDLKLDNILIHFPDRDNNKKITDEELKAIDLSTEKFVVKIADLGFAREIDDDAKKRRFTYVGSPLLMPPEPPQDPGHPPQEPHAQDRRHTRRTWEYRKVLQSFWRDFHAAGAGHPRGNPWPAPETREIGRAHV